MSSRGRGIRRGGSGAARGRGTQRGRGRGSYRGRGRGSYRGRGRGSQRGRGQGSQRGRGRGSQRDRGRGSQRGRGRGKKGVESGHYPRKEEDSQTNEDRKKDMSENLNENAKRANWLGSRPKMQFNLFDKKKTDTASQKASQNQGQETKPVEKGLVEPCSRLCVKNLPKKIGDKRLKKVFSDKGEVTDIKIIRTSSGKPRFAFIGFKTMDMAATAKEYFNKTFIDTSRISVEFAASHKSSAIRPWSKYSKGSSRHKRRNPKLYLDSEKGDKNISTILTAKKSVYDEIKEMKKDEKFRTFLGLNKNRKDVRFWDNDDNNANEKNKENSNNNESKKTTLQCPEKHNLVQFTTKAADFYCNLCEKKNIPVGSVMHGCRLCDWDVCHNCFQNETKALFAPDSYVYLNNIPTRWKNYHNGQKAKVVMKLPNGEVRVQFEKTNLEATFSTQYLTTTLKEIKINMSTKGKLGFGLEGNVVVRVHPDSQASAAKIECGWRISSINGKKQEDNSIAVAEAFKKAKTQEYVVVIFSKPQNMDEMAYLKSKQTGDFDSSDSDSDENNDKYDHEMDFDSGRLFVRNLSYIVTEEEVHKHFEKFGPIASIHLPLTSANTPKGFAYVLYMFPEHAIKAYQALDKTIFQGRLMHILPSKQSLHDISSTNIDSETGGYKRKKRIKQKEQDHEDNWNSLFIRQDTVAGATAARYGITKGQLLDRDTSNVAVRMALAETTLLSETKELLEKEGISLEAFSGSRQKAVRSNTVLLIKNIPYDCTISEIRGLFGRFGDLGRLVLPETRTMALVEFLASGDAKRAFRGLAYKKFKHVPIYLEWAPVKVFSKDYSGSQLLKKKATEAMSTKETDYPNQTIKVKDDQKSQMDNSIKAENSDDDSTTTLFVKNLNFSTTQAGLEKVFRDIDDLRTVTIPHKTATRENKQVNLSMGYGFVEFGSHKSAMKALKTLQSYELDGHKILLKLSSRKSTTNDHSKQKRKSKNDTPNSKESTKILVKNIAFEATRDDLRQLFGAYGQIKQVRLPRKFDRSHRGFGFIDFLTKQEAKNAMNSLQNTHLYGRHMVLQWAKEEVAPDAALQPASKLQSTDKQSYKKRKKLIKDIDDSTTAFQNAFNS